MGASKGFKLAPALVSGPGAQDFRPPHALVLTPNYSLKTSSKPMTLPPFVIRLTHPSSLVRYPVFPETD